MEGQMGQGAVLDVARHSLPHEITTHAEELLSLPHQRYQLLHLTQQLRTCTR